MKRVVWMFLVLCMCVTSCTMNKAPVSDQLEVHYIDVGQADCIFLRCSGQTMLIDGGNVDDSDLVVSYLLDQGVSKLDYVVNTHAHEDHVGGLPGVLAVFETSNIWCPVTYYDSACFEDFLYYADQQDLPLFCPDPGTTYTLGQAEISVLGPVKEYEETNDTSIILRVDHGRNSFLFTGDAERQAEQDVLDEGYDVSSTVLKVGHHGSSTSTSYRWLREVAPQYAVIQVGKDNSYGHPHDEVMSRLRDADVTVYRTDLQGHIVCVSDGETVSFAAKRTAPVTNPTKKEEQFVGNRNSKKFHLTTCDGLPQKENRVYFDSYDEAIEQGYSPCGNCMG